MPPKTNIPTATSDDAGLNTKSDLLAELQEQEAEQAQAAQEQPAPSVQLSGGTLLDTNTEYEDRTRNPVDEVEVEYEVEEVTLDGGTVLTNVLNPKAN